MSLLKKQNLRGIRCRWLIFIALIWDSVINPCTLIVPTRKVPGALNTEKAHLLVNELQGFE